MQIKKEIIKTTIALHPIQVALIKGLQKGTIDLEKDSLRTIGIKIGLGKNPSPQKVKHHLGSLVTLGVLQIIRGQYVYYKD